MEERNAALSRILDNQQACRDAITKVIAGHNAVRPANTVKMYANRQREFCEWCAQRRFADGELVREDKLVLFLSDHVIPRGNKRVKLPNGEPKPLSLEGVEAYTKAVVALYQFQKTATPETQTNSHPRGLAVKSLLDTLQRTKTKRKLANYEDRGLGTVLDGYNIEDMKQLSEYWLGKGTGEALRDRVDFLLGHALLARGENKRHIQLPDLLTLSLPDEGPQTCTPLVVIINRGKTNQHGRTEYGAVMRCKELLVCPMNAVAMYLFWRWQVDLEVFPDMSTRQGWYDIHLLKGKDPKHEISYTAQLEATKRAFKACGIESSVWTHANRGSAAKLAEAAGADEAQIRRAGRWNSEKLEGCYLTTLPRKAMRALAGFRTKGGSYWLDRGVVMPPDALQHLVYPGIEDAERQLKTSGQREIAGHAFLKMLKDMNVLA